MIVLKVAARYQALLAGKNDNRAKARKLTTPINKPKGIAKDIVKENGSLIEQGRDDELSDPAKNDIRPADVFNLTPNNGSVLNFVETGKDLEKTLNKQVPKDKGYETVSNLSQYLISTEGGGGTRSVG